MEQILSTRFQPALKLLAGSRRRLRSPHYLYGSAPRTISLPWCTSPPRLAWY